MKPDDLMDAFGGLPEDFIAQELEYKPSKKRTAFLVSKPFLAGLSAAACLIVTVGLSVGIWSRHQRIDTRPPQETQTTTVMQTETRSETTAQVTTESQVIEKQTVPTTKMQETTVMQPEVITSHVTAEKKSTMTVAETTLEPTASAKSVETSAAITVPTITVMTTVSTIPTYAGHYQTLPSREYHQPKTFVTTHTIVSSAIHTTMGTIPSQTTSPPSEGTPPSDVVTTTERQSTTVVITSQTTIPPPCEDVTPPGGGTVTTESSISPEMGDQSPGEPGFRIEFMGDIWYFTPVCTGKEPKDFRISYVIDGERYQIKSEETNTIDGKPFRLFQLYDTELQTNLLLSQFLMQDFSCRVFPSVNESADDLRDTFPVTGVSGFVVSYQDTVPFYCIYWTDGNYVMSIITQDSRQLYSKLPEQFRAAKP